MLFQVGSKRFFIDVNKNLIESILLVGSVINGDSDEKSDLDFIIIINNCNNYVKSNIHKNLSMEMDIPLDWITLYTKYEFILVCNNGKKDLYMWYVNLRHKVIYSRSNFTKKIFDNMTLYTDVQGRVGSRLEVTNSLIKAYKKGEYSPEYVLNIIMRNVRDACINICFLMETLEFCKYRPIELCYKIKGVNMPFTYNEYVNMYELKREYKNDPTHFKLGEKADEIVMEWYRKYIRLAKEVLKLENRKMTNSFENPIEKEIDGE